MKRPKPTIAQPAEYVSMTPSDWQAATGTDKLAPLRRKGCKAYRSLNGRHIGAVVVFETVGPIYRFACIEAPAP